MKQMAKEKVKGKKEVEVKEEKKENMKKEMKEKKAQENKSEAQKDIKLGELELREGSVLVIKKTNYKGEDRIDFRVWLNMPSYKGPTKQGFVLRMNKIDDFVKIVENMKKKLKGLHQDIIYA